MSTSGWIGVDLDGTLAQYDGWRGENHIGEPVPLMAWRVRNWLADGRVVKIFTARVSREAYWLGPVGIPEPMTPSEARVAVEAWSLKHFGVRLPVVCRKDYQMVELWDDRAVQVEPNTGRRMDGKE